MHTGPQQDKEECTGDPYNCQCTTCREWLIDVLADRAYDTMR